MIILIRITCAWPFPCDSAESYRNWPGWPSHKGTANRTVSLAGSLLQASTRFNSVVSVSKWPVFKTLIKSAIEHSLLSGTNFGSVEDGMIHPQSFLLFHSSVEQSRAVQGNAFDGRDSTDG